MTKKEAIEMFNRTTHCQICGNKFGFNETRTILKGRVLGTFLVVCDGDEDCPMSKRPWKPKEPKQ